MGETTREVMDESRLVSSFSRLALERHDILVVRLAKSAKDIRPERFSRLQRYLKEKTGWEGSLIVLSSDDADIRTWPVEHTKKLYEMLKRRFEPNYHISDVSVGQIWESKDPRDKNGQFEVSGLSNTHAFIKYVSSSKTSKIRLDRFRPTSRGYQLVGKKS